MYYPYLSGRLYHVLALKRLVNENLLSRHIVPLIEPVKITDYFLRTLDSFIAQQHRVAIILNPRQPIPLDYQEARLWEQYLEKLQSPYIQKVILFDESIASFDDINAIAQEFSYQDKRISFFITDKASALSFELLFGKDTKVVSFIPASFQSAKGMYKTFVTTPGSERMQLSSQTINSLFP